MRKPAFVSLSLCSRDDCDDHLSIARKVDALKN